MREGECGRGRGWMRERVGARKRVVDRELTRVRVKWIRLSD